MTMPENLGDRIRALPKELTPCSYRGDVQGSNCAEWECPKCLSRFVSPSVARCACIPMQAAAALADEAERGWRDAVVTEGRAFDSVEQVRYQRYSAG